MLSKSWVLLPTSSHLTQPVCQHAGTLVQCKAVIHRLAERAVCMAAANAFCLHPMNTHKCHVKNAAAMNMCTGRLSNYDRHRCHA